MKYLFFDIECSNCFQGKGKMCEFGYVLTDEKFKIIDQDSLIMSPGKGREFRFDQKIYERDPEFEWAYYYDYYFDCEEFPAFYKKIKKVMEDKETIIFGHSVDHDIRYLDYTCHRYNLEPIQYVAYDTQIMIRYYFSKHEKQMGLDYAAKILCEKREVSSLDNHLSMDDANKTMLVMKHMCINLNVEVKDLITLCPDSLIDMDKCLSNLRSRY